MTKTTRVELGAENTKSFFAWFRTRAGNLDRLLALQSNEANFVPEANVMLATSLDALANYWGETFRPEVSGRARFGEFLRACGGSDIFARCCRSELLDIAGKTSTDMYLKVQAILGDAESDGILRHWHEDPLLIDLLREPRFVALRLDKKLVRDTQYGEVIYRHYRSGWVHGLQLCPALSTGPFHREREEPWYENVFSNDESSAAPRTVRVLVLPWQFLRRLLDRAIDNFERQCTDESRSVRLPLGN